MKKYKNKHGDSGVVAYEPGADYIIVKFLDNISYLYTDKITGSENIKEMKRLAISGKGLSTFISQHVKDNYARKLS